MNWKSLKLIEEIEKEEVEVLIRLGDDSVVPSYTTAMWLPQKKGFQKFFGDSQSYYPLSFIEDNAYYINLKEILF